MVSYEFLQQRALDNRRQEEDASRIFAPVPTSQEAIQAEIQKVENERATLAKEADISHGATYYQYESLQRRADILRNALITPDLAAENARLAAERTERIEGINRISSSESSVGGGRLGGGSGKARVISTSKAEDQIRAGYYSGNPTLDPRVTDNFSVPESSLPTRSSSGALPSSLPSSKATIPITPEKIAGVRAGVKSIIPPIQNRELRGSTITAKQLKEIRAGRLTEAEAVAQNQTRGRPTDIISFTPPQTRTSVKVLGDILPSSSAFLSLGGSPRLEAPTPPREPASLSYTQEQVNNLSDSEYKQYVKDFEKYNTEVSKFEKAVDLYNKKIQRENEIAAREFVSTSIRQGQSSFIVKANGVTKIIPPEKAVSEYQKALKKDPNATLNTPQLVQLSESLNISDRPIGPTGIIQDESGKISTLVSEIKPLQPTFRPNQFIPLSVSKEGLTGITELGKQQELVTVGFGSEALKPTEQSNMVSKNFDEFSKGIEDATKRASKNYVGQALGEAGKDLYATIPATSNLINEYVVSPLEKQFSKDTSFKRKELYVPTTLTGIGSGALIAAPLKLVQGKGIINAKDELLKGYEGLDKYVKEYGIGTVPGAVVSLIAPSPAGGKLSPLKIGRQTFEIIPEQGIKYTKYTVRGPSEKGEIVESFKTLEAATKRQQELIQAGISKEAKVSAQFRPVSSLEFVGNPIITKIGSKYFFGGLKGRSKELAEQYRFLNPAEPIEIATLKPFSRNVILSKEGRQALVESGRARPRDIIALQIENDIVDIITKNRKSIKPKDYGTFRSLESLKTPLEQEVLFEEILPKSKVPVKGHAAELAQVRPDILTQVATRATTGDIDRDFMLAGSLRSIGLGGIAERISYRAAKKDAEQSQKLLQGVATGKRSFEVRGTKVYALEGESKAKVLENLTEKEASGKGSPISDFGKIFGSKYRFNIVKGVSPLGKKIKYRSIEDQLFSKIASISRLQSKRTGLFEQGGTPDYLKTGKFETTPEGFTIRTDLHRVKDFVDTIKLDIPEIGARLKTSGKKASGTRLEKLGRELESLYPEIDFGSAPKIIESLGEQAPIPSRLSQIGITPESVLKYGPSTAIPISVGTQKPEKRSTLRNSKIESLVSKIGSEPPRLSKLSSFSSTSFISEISPTIKSPLSQTRSTAKSQSTTRIKSAPSIISKPSPVSKLSGLSPISAASKISPISASSQLKPTSPLSPISKIYPLIPKIPKPLIPPVPPRSPKIPVEIKFRRVKSRQPFDLGYRRFFYTNPSDPLAPGVILKAGVPELRSASPKIFKQVDVLLRKARKKKGSTFGVYQPYAGLELNKIVGGGFKGTNLLSQKISIRM